MKNLLELSDVFSIKLAQIEGQKPEADLNQAYEDLKNTMDSFLSQNTFKMDVTKRPYTKPATENKKAVVAAGFVITELKFNEFINKLNSEINKLQAKYPDVEFYGYYDSRSEYKAKL